VTEQVDAIIVGAGQAGLATSWHLTQRGVEHVVLERGRVGETWRTERWESFVLNTPNWTLQLPGHVYDGPDPDAFAPLAEVLEYLEGYAGSFAAPVREHVAVTGLRAADDGYDVQTDGGPLRARTVIVATGAYQRPTPSPLRNAVPAGLFHQDATEYRSPAALPDGAVLVVGSGQTGCQIAEDLLGAGRDVYLAVGACPWFPRRYRGRDMVAWLLDVGRMDQTVDTLESPAALDACNPALSGTEGGHDCNPVTLAARGVALAGRLEGFRGGRAQLAGDLRENLAKGFGFEAQLRQSLDDYIRAAGLDAPEEPAPPLAPPAPAELRELDCNDLGAIVWAAGYRPDYSWIGLPVLDGAGRPVHRRGLTELPGLAFVGLHWLHKRKSSLLLGVGEDAEHVAAQL
jgi:putative flavoprotein involved in K+ transport